MPQTTYFVKECPTCGRKLQVRVEYLGREMVCNHCGGDFLAGDARDAFTPNEDECSDAMLLRVDDLIDKADNNPGKPKQCYIDLIVAIYYIDRQATKGFY